MKLISWNVNGLRAVVKKGFTDIFTELDADIFCLQEIKLQDGQLDLELEGYEQYYNYAEKKGYSGTAIFTRTKPINVQLGVGVEELDTEGRVITLEFDSFYVVTVYTPNAQRALARIDHRMAWEDAFRQHLMELDKKKPVIMCGDLNVAHEEIDLKNPKSNRGNAGFSDEERGKMTELLNSGFKDSYRLKHPGEEGAYTWWSYRFSAREKNVGWRLDYFIVSDRLETSIADTMIYSHVMGSDHCPVGIEITL